MPDATPIEIPEEQPWAIPMPGESQRWFMRLSLFAGLGAARSIRAVYNAELVARGATPGSSRAVPSSWTKAAKRFEWLRRAEKFDEWRRKELFATGNAQDTERIKKLDALINKLCERAMEALDSVDLSLASVDEVAKLTTQLLSAIDLMAKHTGGYAAQRVEHTGRDGGAIEVEERKLNVFWYMPQIQEVDDVAGSEGQTAISGGDDAGEAEQSDA